MFLHLCVALLGDASGTLDSGSSIDLTTCGDTSGICAACASENPRYPYFDGARCVSCSVGTAWAQPFFYEAENRCVSECPAEAFFADENRVCRQCPAESPYWDANTKKCMSCSDLYGRKRPYWNPTFGDCVA